MGGDSLALVGDIVLVCW